MTEETDRTEPEPGGEESAGDVEEVESGEKESTGSASEEAELAKKREEKAQEG